MASFRMLSTMSTRSTVAFSPIKPIRKTCSTVGPRPPLISTLYLEKKERIQYGSLLRIRVQYYNTHLRMAYSATFFQSTPKGTLIVFTVGKRSSSRDTNISRPSSSMPNCSRLEHS